MSDTHDFKFEAPDGKMRKADDVGINVGINGGVNVGINEQRVLDALRADASLSAVKIGQLLGITTRQAERLLASLREKNLIRRIGANKNGHWEIVQC